MKDDEWKGENKISAKNKAASTKETNRLKSSIYHRQRRERGEPCAARKKHNAVMSMRKE